MMVGGRDGGLGFSPYRWLRVALYVCQPDLVHSDTFIWPLQYHRKSSHSPIGGIQLPVPAGVLAPRDPIITTAANLVSTPGPCRMEPPRSHSFGLALLDRRPVIAIFP